LKTSLLVLSLALSAWGQAVLRVPPTVNFTHRCFDIQSHFCVFSVPVLLAQTPDRIPLIKRWEQSAWYCGPEGYQGCIIGEPESLLNGPWVYSVSPDYIRHEPVDVPAIRKHKVVDLNPGDPPSGDTMLSAYLEGAASGAKIGCGLLHGKLDGWHCTVNEWTCADKNRFLLTSEDGKKHCVTFQ
jgi:hypothetical protein